MNYKNEREINIIYFNKYKLRVFGDKFVENNKNKCKIICNDKEIEINSYIINETSNKTNNNIELKLRIDKDISNASYIFYGCEDLKELPDISKLITNKIIDMSYMFYGCKNLSSIDISKWDTSNVKDMSYMFYGFESLSSLPNISKINTRNVIDMSNIFEKCDLTNTNLSQFNTQNVENMDFFLPNAKI